MYCKNCGNQINDNDQFCQKCGAPVNFENKDLQTENYAKKKKKRKIIVIISIVIVIFLLFKIASTGDNNSSNEDSYSYSISKTILYDKNGITITANDKYSDDKNIGCNISIDNETKADYDFRISNFAVNDWMIYGDYKTTVSSTSIETSAYALNSSVVSNSSSDTKFLVSKDALDENHIEDIYSFSFVFNITTDTKGYDDIQTKVIVLKTDNEKPKDSNVEKSIYNKNGIKVFKVESTDKTVEFYVKNTKKEYLTVDLHAIAFNGKTDEDESDSFSFQNIFPGYKCLYSLEPSNSEITINKCKFNMYYDYDDRLANAFIGYKLTDSIEINCK